MLYYAHKYKERKDFLLEQKMDWLNKSNTKKILFLAFSILIMAVLIFNYAAVGRWLGKMVDIIFPFILGGAMAFVFNVLLRGIETRVIKKEFKGKRGTCILITLLIVLAIITGALVIIIPQLIESITQLAGEIKTIAATFGGIDTLKETIISKVPQSRDYLEKLSVNYDYKILLNKLTDFLSNMASDTGDSSIFSSVTSAIGSVFSGFATFLIGFAFSIYCLFRKEALARQSRQIVYALFREKTADRILEIASLANVTFSNFIRGQCLEACILGLMFLVTMTIFGTPYALLVSVIVSITAFIPIFGALIGGCLSGFLILIISPKQALIFFFMCIALQQIEGKLVYPHVVGSSVGLPSIWVLFSITVGGELLGVAGMIIFVPLCSVLYALFREFVVEKLRTKKVPSDYYRIPYSTRKAEELEAKILVDEKGKREPKDNENSILKKVFSKKK